MLTTRCEGKTFMRNLFQNEEFELDVLEAYKKSRWVKTTTKQQQQQQQQQQRQAKIKGRDNTILTKNRRERKVDETFNIRRGGVLSNLT